MVKKTSQTTSTPDEGLPEISEKKRKNPVLLILLISLILLLGIHFIFNFKAVKNKTKFAVEESYTLPSNEQVSSKSSMSKGQPETKLSEQQLALLQAKKQELQQRLSASLMLFSQNDSKSSVSKSEKSSAKMTSSDPNSQFLRETSRVSEKTIHATMLGPLSQFIGEGQLIHAILETAINSDLPGSLRAVIDQSVYAEDGLEVLIPPGTRLIGQYKSGLLQGQSRIFIVWTRLITPDGLSLHLESPGVDSLGMAGMAADVIERHFWQRFGTATLLSILGAGTSNIGVANNSSYNAAQAYRQAIANSLNQTAQQTLQQQSMISPILWVNQGSPIQVFVAHDLDFRSIHQEANSKINVF